MTGSASATSAGVMPSRLSSSAWRAARRHVTFGPLPPTMIGTRGCWIGFGTLIASLTLACRPSYVACWCLSPASIAVMTPRSSPSRASRSFVSGKP